MPSSSDMPWQQVTTPWNSRDKNIAAWLSGWLSIISKALIPSNTGWMPFEARQINENGANKRPNVQYCNKCRSLSQLKTCFPSFVGSKGKILDKRTRIWQRWKRTATIRLPLKPLADIKWRVFQYETKHGGGRRKVMEKGKQWQWYFRSNNSVNLVNVDFSTTTARW